MISSSIQTISMQFLIYFFIFFAKLKHLVFLDNGHFVARARRQQNEAVKSWNSCVE